MSKIFSPLKFLTTLDAPDPHCTEADSSLVKSETSFDEMQGVVPFDLGDMGRLDAATYYNLTSAASSAANAPTGATAVSGAEESSSAAGQPHILRKRCKRENANDLSFDLSSGGLMSGGLYANPTAQSTPVGASKRPGQAAGASSMLTTPNNSLLSMHNAVNAASVSEHDSHHLSNINHHQSTPSKGLLHSSAGKYSPVRHYSSRLSDAPRTPTPFKKALADVFNRGEPISDTPQTPTKLVEDLREIMRKEDQQSDVSMHSEISLNMADSGFGEKSRRGGQGGANGAPGGDKENHSPNKRGVRKSLASTWMGARGAGASNTVSGASNVTINSTVGCLDESLTAPETPSKSLLGTSDASMLFSPPQILKETGLHPADDSGAPGMDSYSGSGGAGKSSSNIKEQSGGGVAGSSGSGETSSSGNGGSPEPKSKLDVRWNMIACGKTRPTLEMTEQARNYLNTMKPRSLDL